MKTLVVIDAFQAGAASAGAKVVAAASKLGGAMELLVVGPHAAEEAAKLKGQPVEKIHTYAPDSWVFPSAEQLTAIITEHFSGFDCYLTAANTTGKDFLPRLAAKLGVQPVTDIIEVLGADSYKRPIYAGNVIVTVTDSQPVKCLTVRPTSFSPLNPPAGGGTNSCPIEELKADLPEASVSYEQPEVAGGDTVDITTARMVISAGNGIGTKEKFVQVEQLAAKLGAGVGASRALVDSGVALNECQVGQTGKVVAPEVYVALGISGAIQHIAGMKDSGTIIAVNRDEEAPIFGISDYMLVADLDEVLPKLIAAFQ